MELHDSSNQKPSVVNVIPLRYLRTAPPDWQLPVVWNCHAYSTSETLSLLTGVADAYIPDLKYGSDECGRRWSSVPDYPRIARECIEVMLTRDVPVIVRILVLPGHYKCCHAPTIEFLNSVNSDNLVVSIRGQYAPDWKICDRDELMSWRITDVEVREVEALAVSLGLRAV
jgi:uncharacterized Fe-S radical SAM superfamily protein PflX